MKNKRQNVFRRVLCMVLVALLLIPCLPVSASAASVDLFDANWYASHNPDVVRALGRSTSALRGHYNNYGKYEGRSPSAVFDPKVYISLYPDLKAAFGTNYAAALNHYINNGLAEGRKGSAYFNVSVYKANYQDLRDAYGNNNALYAVHYIKYGQYEGRNATSELMQDVTTSFAGKKITLKSVQNGKYLCADGNYSNVPARANRSAASTWETFTVTVTPDGWAGLQAYNGKWVTANRNKVNTPLEATASRLQSWECFKIYQKGSNYYLKAQVNGKFLCVRVDSSNAPVQAYAGAASTWERFQITVILSPNQQNMVNQARNLLGSTNYNGYCQKFVRVVGNKIGLPDGGAGSALAAYNSWCVSKSMDNIPVGAAVYFRSKNTKSAGYKYGHVGIYVGDGKVIHALATVREQSLTDMLSNYNYLGWGWQAGVDLR
ncbi:MAG: hypothetical protein IJ043_08090 [Clostridia bacterium]|nr:hypothetical protein [Clostridia bacterium]